MRPTTLRDEILAAFERLERDTGRLDFRLREIVEEVKRVSPHRKEVSIRTQIGSVMCADAPVHHANHTDDLLRVGHGVYRRARNAGRVEDPPPSPTGPAVPTEHEWPWPWEGVVVDVYAAALEAAGWEIVSRSDTASRQQGVDLVARRGSSTRYVEAKGYPSTVYQTGPKKGQPKPTNPATQARVWFSGALLSAMLMEAAYPDGEIVMLFPGFPTYRSLAERLTDGLSRIGVRIHLVSEHGRIEEMTPGH